MKITFPMVIKLKESKDEPAIEFTVNTVDEYDQARSKYRNAIIISLVDAAGVDFHILQLMIPDYVRGVCEKRIAKHDSKCATCVQRELLIKPKQVADVDVVYACHKEYSDLSPEARDRLIH